PTPPLSTSTPATSPAAMPLGHDRKREGEGEADRRVHREAVATPGDPLLVGQSTGRPAENVPGHGHAEVEPHAEEAQPGEDLDPGKTPHRLRHRDHVAKDLGAGGSDAALLSVQ